MRTRPILCGALGAAPIEGAASVWRALHLGPRLSALPPRQRLCRRIYDNYGEEGINEGMAGGGGGGMADIFDMFGGGGGRQRERKSENVHHKLQVSEAAAAAGWGGGGMQCLEKALLSRC